MDKQEIKVVINEALAEQAMRQHQEFMSEQAGAAGVSLWTEEQIEVITRLVKEARTQSELPELLSNEFNTILLDGYKEHMTLWPQIFSLVNTVKKEVEFPGLVGINVVETSSGEEKHFTGPCSGEAHIKPLKYACLVGFTEEMLDDCEVDLMGWTLRKIGHKFKQKEDEIAFGRFTARGGAMGTNTNTGLNAAAIQEAMGDLMNRTVTCNQRSERDPVAADTIVIDPLHLMQARELLNASLTVVPNVAAQQMAGGTNIFQNILNIVVTPYVDTTYFYVGKAGIGGGTIFVRRGALVVRNWTDLLREAENVKASSRFYPDIAEPTKWQRVAY